MVESSYDIDARRIALVSGVCRMPCDLSYKTKPWYSNYVQICVESFNPFRSEQLPSRIDE